MNLIEYSFKGIERWTHDGNLSNHLIAPLLFMISFKNIENIMYFVYILPHV